MIFRMKPLILCLMLACAASVFAQFSDRDVEKDALCEKWNSVPLPADASGIPEPKSFPRCDSYKLYSGIGGKVDFVAARKCAWSERLATEAGLRQTSGDPIPWAIGGSIILTELYANGEGVQKNIPLALRLACEANGDEGKELEDLLKRMEQPNATKFSYCDHAYDTFTMNFCAAYTSEIEDDKRAQAISRLSSNWTQAQKSTFADAQKAFEEYVTTVGRRETYLGGTIRNIRVDGVEQELKQAFFDELLKFEHGDLPHGSSPDYQHADSDLNTVYRKVLDAAKSPEYPSDDGEIQPGGIHDTERSWLHYRDAWIAFAQLRYPSTSQNAWSQWLTATRTKRLKLVLCEFNSKDSLCTPEILKSLDGEP